MRLEDLLKGIIEIPSYEEPKELFRFALITYIERMGVITEGNFERFLQSIFMVG